MYIIIYHSLYKSAIFGLEIYLPTFSEPIECRQIMWVILFDPENIYLNDFEHVTLNF